MTKQRHILALVTLAGVTVAARLVAAPAAAPDQGTWPASKASAPTPKVAGMPAELAKNLANFDDLDFHVAEWTAVMGFLDGTFTKPMTLADGTVIQPTGKAYNLSEATLGRVNHQGVT